jgi:hypothetical protein
MSGCGAEHVVPRIWIEPLWLTASELQSLADDLRNEGYSVGVGQRDDYRLERTTMEVVQFFVNEVGRDALSAAVGAVTTSFVVWARNKARRKLPRRHRATRAHIYGPDEQLLRTVIVRRHDAEPEISDEP